MEQEAYEEHLPEPEYLKGFNDGYLIAKHEPELASQLTARKNDHSLYFLGLVGGKQEYDKEMREWAKSFSKGQPDKEDRDMGKER